jgi:hypothetical protein
VQKAYVHKVIDTLQDLDNVLYEISNESNPGSVEWQYYMINLIRVYEGTKQKQHPILMSAIEDGWHEKKILLGPADAISPAGGVSGNDPPKADGGRVMISDTDHIFGVGGDHNWVWKSFTRGHNPIYMDPITDPEWEAHRRVRNPEWHLARLAMGHTRAYATRMNLAATEPRTDLCSTAYCLADPGFEYLVYLPFGSHWMERWVELLPHWIESWIDSMSLFSRRVTIDLSGSSETLNVEWFNPRTGDITPAGKTTGGVRRSFRAPFGGDAVLYLYSRN